MQTIKYQGTLDARCLVARSVWWNGLIPPTGMQSAFVIGLDPGAQVSYFAVKVDIGFGDAMVRAPPTCSVLSFGCVSVDFSKDNPVHDALTNPLESVWESPELADQCTFQTLYSLVERCKRATTESCVVWGVTILNSKSICQRESKRKCKTCGTAIIKYVSRKKTRNVPC